LVHCKCLQGFTGNLQGNRSAGISNLWGLYVFPCKNCRDFDFTGIPWGYPTLNVGKSCKKIFFVDISVNFLGIPCKF
jgi:hypothetical protein